MQAALIARIFRFQEEQRRSQDLSEHGRAFDKGRAMTVQFPELHELLGHDADKVRLVTRAFYRGAAMDLQRLVRAAATQEWQAVSELAQRIQLDCLQLSENEMATAVAELGRVPGGRFADTYSRYEAVIDGLLSRVNEFAR